MSEPAAMGERVALGEVSCPSGELVIMDGGYLGLWSGERSPAPIDPAGLGAVGEESAQNIRASVDYQIVGPDAEAAARSFNRQSGVTLYDIPVQNASEFTATFAAHCATNGLDARLEPFPDRVPHRERVRRCIARGDYGFVISGVPVVAAGGLPTDRMLPVDATIADGEEMGWWHDVRLRVSDGEPATEQHLGTIGVDWARFAFADADALSSWHHEESIDGRADAVFWGRDAQAAASAFGALEIHTPGESGCYGWLDRPFQEAIEHALAVDEWKSAGPDRRLMVDFRPHSHHWQAMRGVRATDHAAGEVDVAGARILFASTGRGDGFFPVFADRDAAGNLVSIRLVLGE
jgi:hypothetical protein